MKKIDEVIEIIEPKKQCSLFGYNNYFKYFVTLYKKKKLPNSLILNGPKGIGKATFAYHFINFIFSENETMKYSIDNLFINENNSSFRLMNEDIHPNFFLIENKNYEREIKIEQIRSLLKFINKSTYSRDMKIILIDNVQNLNLSSSNAMLKALEEPLNNTFFIIINDNSYKVLPTIKSRCTEFIIYFTKDEKKNIFKNIINQYGDAAGITNFDDNFYFDSPGNIIKYFLIFKKAKIDINKNNLENILFFIDKYNNEKKPETLSFLSLFIEKFYRDLCLENPSNLEIYFLNYTKILNLIRNIKKFNLYEKNNFILIKELLKNESR